MATATAKRKSRCKPSVEVVVETAWGFWHIGAAGGYIGTAEYGWFRHDKYVSKATGKACVQISQCVDRDDISVSFLDMKHDSLCACCKSGQLHTTDYHIKQIAR